MITEDQSAVIEFLASPAAHEGATVERIDTHASVVFVSPTRALKLKRAVRFDYLDFSTAARRRAMCEAEVRLNRRTAPSLYRGVLPVTRDSAGHLGLDGRGTAVDWVVEMDRFEQDDLFDRRAEAGRLSIDLMPALADAVAAFHASAEPRRDHGGSGGMAWVIDGNEAGLTEFGAGVVDPLVMKAAVGRSRAALARWRDLLDERRAAGYVRQCHGDMHLRNIVLRDGRPTLFDGVEFNDEIACVDVLYDLAFLLMDLAHRGLRPHASVLWNRYLDATGSLEGLELLPLFLSCRAAVRAKITATAAAVPDADTESLRRQAREYLDLAAALIEPVPPTLVAIGGLSGSGKSVLARALAPLTGGVPGAVVHRSDVVRKRLCGVAPLDHLPAWGYTAGISARVYRTLASRARTTVQAGQTAIVDAVFARADDRREVATVARSAGVPFVGIWLEAPEATRIARVAERRGDESDADAALIRRQPLDATGAVDWWRIDASRSAADVLRDATDRVLQQQAA